MKRLASQIKEIGKNQTGLFSGSKTDGIHIVDFEEEITAALMSELTKDRPSGFEVETKAR